MQCLPIDYYPLYKIMSLNVQGENPSEVTAIPRAVTLNHPTPIISQVTTFPHSLIEDVIYPKDVFLRWVQGAPFTYSTSTIVASKIFNLDVTVDWLLGVFRSMATTSGFTFPDRYISFTGKMEIEFYFTPSSMYAGKVVICKSVQPFGWRDLIPGGARRYATTLPGVSITPDCGDTIKFEIDCTTLYGGIPTKLGNYLGIEVRQSSTSTITQYFSHPLRDYHFCRIEAFALNQLRTVSVDTSIAMNWRYRFSEISFNNMSPSFAKVPPVVTNQ